MREQAEELGGTITVDSRPGEGTTIRVWVPVDSRAEARSDREARQTERTRAVTR
jgi:signal transduction histidine kinase